MAKLKIFLFLVLLTGCGSTYQLGDISKRYCYSTDEQFRAIIKATLTRKGFNIGIDYCSAHGLIDALVIGGGNE